MQSFSSFEQDGNPRESSAQANNTEREEPLKMPLTNFRLRENGSALDLDETTKLLDSVVGPYGGKTRIKVTEDTSATRVYWADDKAYRQTWSICFIADFKCPTGTISLEILKASITGRKDFEEKLPQKTESQLQVNFCIGKWNRNSISVLKDARHTETLHLGSSLAQSLEIASLGIAAALRCLDRYENIISLKNIERIYKSGKPSKKEFTAIQTPPKGIIQELVSVFSKRYNRVLPPIATLTHTADGVIVEADSLTAWHEKQPQALCEQRLFEEAFDATLQECFSQNR
ncbi:MAG: hypothetical protein KDD62_04310 [Bdellovibrionales bacterium]|nr:hypothetical protein [Bdellovibrionales bacterium]